MENVKQCPFCAEDIRSEAIVCKYCRADLQASDREKSGKYVKVRVKTGDQIYSGELFVPDYLHRVSDVLNDRKDFIILSGSVEENKVRDIPIGFIAVNKSRIEWIRLMEGQRPHQEGATFAARSTP